MELSAEPAPVGFPGCRSCPYRLLARPDVCLSCLEASPGQAAGGVGPRCACCGQRRDPGRPCPTGWCARRDRAWSVVFPVGVYAGGLRRAILRYKFGQERWWAGVLARLVAGYLDRNAGWFEEFDLLAATPAYTGAGSRRGWDAVGAVLAEVSGLAGAAWPVAPGAVAKRSETRPMSVRACADRRAAAAHELRAVLSVTDPSAVAGRRVLVLDDVMAEGSTLREVARCLRRAGAREVAGLVVARAPWTARSGGGPARSL